MKSLLIGALLVLAPVMAQANDSSFEGVGGSPRPTKGENKAIRMVRETVILTAHANDYSTQADFIFSNETGTAQKVTMGFPEGNFGDVNTDKLHKSSGFRGFKTFVDGSPIAASRINLSEMDESGFDTYWVKTVSFAPRQTRRVRVTFSSPYGGTVNWGLTRALSYSFTGKNWRGDVSESVPQQGLWRAVAMANNGKPLAFQAQTSATGATFRKVWKNWQAQDGVVFGLERVLPFWREDVTGADNGSTTLAFVNASHTVRVGAKPAVLESPQGMPTQGFTYNGVFYVSVDHLENKLESWGDEQKPKIKTELKFSPATGFDLRAGKTRIQGQEGDKMVRVNGKLLAVGGPILGVSSSDYESLYVPLAAIAHQLGWKMTMRGERLFTLERGNWKG